MKVYTRVSTGGNLETEKRMPVHKHGETYPAWNFTIKYTIGESALQHHGAMLAIKLYSKRKLGGRYIGEVHALIKELFDLACPYGGNALVNYPVKRGSANSQGALKLSYRFGQTVNVEKLLLAEGFAVWSRRFD